MINIYLRLDLYNEENDTLPFIDAVDLELKEDIYDVLSAYHDADYAELVLVVHLKDVSEEYFKCSFKRETNKKSKLANQWIICDRKLLS